MTANQIQEPAIHVQGLEKSYKELRVLRGVDFEVARGSIFALLGSNGAGKTTVVRILSTLLKHDAGTASVTSVRMKRPTRLTTSLSARCGGRGPTDTTRARFSRGVRG